MIRIIAFLVSLFSGYVMRFLLLIVGFSLVPIKSNSQELWGMTNSGGANSLGTIFKTKSDGTSPTVAYNFQSNSLGADPTGYMVESPSGNLYGITRQGGKHGRGVLFEFNPTSATYSVSVDFDEYSGSSLSLHPNGKMYGIGIRSTFPSVGIILEFDPATNGLSAKVDFEESNTGAFPYGELLLASNGKFYGKTYQGGLNNKGVLFEYDPTLNALIKRLDFDDFNVAGSSIVSLIQINNEKIYGSTNLGGSNNKGVIFEFDLTSNLISKVIDLTDSPSGRLINSNGFLYSVARGATLGGVIIEIDIQNSIVTEKVNFDSYSLTVGSSLSKDLLFYAVSEGAFGLFGFTPPNGITEFGDLNTYPIGEPIRHTNEKVYGLAEEGLFEFSSQSNSTIYELPFSYPNSGGEPRGSLTQHSNGNFYGVTQRLGENNLGVIFEFNPDSNSYKKLTDFNGRLNGAVPYSDLAVAKNGKLYGTTFNGGIYNEGVIFEVDPHSNNLVSKIVDLEDAIAGRPSQGLFVHSNGKLYGVGDYGVSGYGAIFEFDPEAGVLIKKVDLDETIGSPSSGWGFRSTFSELSNGKLLAVTSSGGNNGKGCIFEFDVNSGSILKKIDFTEYLTITGNLVPHPNGMFYATSAFGYKLYQYDLLNNEIKVMFDFESNPDYGRGLSSLTLNPADSNLYGMALSRGSNDLGTIFKYDPINNTLTKTFDFDFLKGANPTGDLTFVKGSQTISFDALPDKTYGDAAFALNAIASSNLNVTYLSSDPTIVDINGASVVILKAGIVTISAEQPGNAIYSSAPPISRELSIAKAGQTISFDDLAPVDLEVGSINLTATATSLLNVAFQSSDPSVASVSESVLNLNEPGTVLITAMQTGNSNYLSAAPVSRELIIQKIVGVTEQPKITIYPNPISDYLNIITDEPEVESSILNSYGQTLGQPKGKHLDIRNLAAGVYALKIKTNAGITLIRFIKN